MSAPVKPWEKSKIGDLPSAAARSTNDELLNNPMYSMGLHSQSPVTSLQTPTMSGPRPIARRPPPLPPALGRVNQGYMPSMGGYGSNMYGGTNMGGYSAMGGYGGYGGTAGYGAYGATAGYGGYGATAGYGGYGSGVYGNYGNTYGRYSQGYGMNRPNQNLMNNLENRFIQMAEESSRPAFESIESLVQTFGSVSFMMESTFGALYSSFRAVLGVAENFGRLRTVFGQVFSTFAVLRFFQWAYKKLLYYLGLRADNPGREAIWQQVSGGVDPVTGEARRSMWPVALFLGIVCSGPYLVWKLLSSISVPPPAPPVQPESVTKILMSWVASKKPVYLGIVKYDFQARTDMEMSVRVYQKLFVAPDDFQTGGRDWLLVLNAQKTQSGFIPSSYVQVGGQFKFPPKPSREPGPVVNEVASVEALLTDATVGPQPPDIHKQDPSFPRLEQFIQDPAAATFLHGDFEPKIDTSNEKIPGDELP